jgi:Endodeoxyribonuclease RusA
MTVFVFSMLVDGISAGERTLSFTVAGEPQVQARTKMHWKNRSKAVCYDPSSRIKEAWILAFKAFVVGEKDGNVQFPIFPRLDPSQYRGFEVIIDFFLLRRSADYRGKNNQKPLLDCCHKFPQKKDLDNLSKFLLDVMNNTVYGDDSAITVLSVTKQFVKEENRDCGAYTVITVKQLSA